MTLNKNPLLATRDFLFLFCNNSGDFTYKNVQQLKDIKMENTTPAKKTLYRNVIVLEVLSEEPINGMSIDDIQDECQNGSFSGIHHFKVTNRALIGGVAVKECLKHGTDVEFFQMDANGFDMNDVNYEVN